MDVPDLVWRVLAFVAVLAAMLLAERLAPRRPDPPQRRQRWVANFGLSLISSGLLALLPVTMLAAAALAEARGWGLLHAWNPGRAGNLLLGMLLLDLAIYGQHRALHRFAPLWRLHRVHHSDTMLDASTGLRFHPGEILLSMLWKSAVTVAIGAAPLTVLVYEIALNACALFNHANWRLPAALERALRAVLVTPDMHRVHHSVDSAETNSNFGNALSLWDRLFASYRAQPARGQLGMRIGLPQTPAQGLCSLLRQPWPAKKGRR